MVELHGWITVRETYDDNDESEKLLEIVDEIKTFIAKLNWTTGMLDIRYYNGTPSITINVFKNHYSEQVKEVFDVFQYITKVAIGSYGLIYIYDDENTEEKDNLFQVFSLAKGKITEFQDKFLSPIIPTIED